MLVSRRVPIKHSNFHFSGDYVSCLGKWADWFPELAMWPDFRWAMLQFDHIRPRSKCTCRWWICYNFKYRAFLLWKEVIDPSTFIIWCNFTLTNGGLGFRHLSSPRSEWIIAKAHTHNITKMGSLEFSQDAPCVFWKARLAKDYTHWELYEIYLRFS